MRFDYIVINKQDSLKPCIDYLCYKLCFVAAENDVSLSTCLFVCQTRLPSTCIVTWDTSSTAKSLTTILETLMKMHLVSRMCVVERRSTVQSNKASNTNKLLAL